LMGSHGDTSRLITKSAVVRFLDSRFRGNDKGSRIFTRHPRFSTRHPRESGGPETYGRVLERFARVRSLLLLTAWGLAVCLGCRTAPTVGPIDRANAVYIDGDYARALTDYRQILREGSDEEDTEWIRYRIAECYFHMGAYSDATESLREYLSLYPKGTYAAEAGSLKAKIGEIWEIRQEERARDFRDLVVEIKRAEKAVQESPHDASLHYRLAGLYWQAGMYDRAAGEYGRAVAVNPSLETDPTVVDRVRLTEDGRFLARLPLVSSDLFGNEGPVQIHNARSRVLSHLDYWGDNRFFVVSGDIENRSIRTQGPVDVLVTVYDFTGNILNSKVTHAGKIPGGETRSFSVRMTVFGSALNIHRYECKLIYRRK